MLGSLGPCLDTQGWEHLPKHTHLNFCEVPCWKIADAMAQVSSSIRQLSLDLRGANYDSILALRIVQRQFRLLQFIHLLRLDSSVQIQALYASCWECMYQLRELSFTNAISLLIVSLPSLNWLLNYRSSLSTIVLAWMRLIVRG